VIKVLTASTVSKGSMLHKSQKGARYIPLLLPFRWSHLTRLEVDCDIVLVGRLEAVDNRLELLTLSQSEPRSRYLREGFHAVL
jgi:hypothetical protein